MAIEIQEPTMKPDPDDYIVHWAQWWGITWQNLLDTAAGTIDRSKANKLHQAACGNLRHSLGIAEKDAKS
jgi:hypothetical protein